MPPWTFSQLLSKLPAGGPAFAVASDLPQYEYTSLPTKSAIRLLELKAVEKN